MAASIPHCQYFWSPENSYTALPDPIQNYVFNTDNFMVGGSLSSSDHHMVVMNSPVSVASFPHDQFVGNPDMVVPKLLSDWDMASTGLCQNDFPYCGYENIDNYQGFSHQARAGDFCNWIVPTNSWPDYHLTSSDAHNWGMQFDKPDMIKIEEGGSDMARIGRYTVEERKNKILKYLKKRNQRNFNKTIKYACRKTLADKRVRIRGRFARNNDSSSADDQQIVMDSNIHTSYQQNMNTSLFYDETLQMVYKDEEEWLKGSAAMAAYFPFTAASQISTLNL